MQNRIINNTFILFWTEIFLKFKAFILVPILTKALGTVDYGAWSQLNIINTLVFPLVLLGTDSSILRYLPDKKIQIQKKVFFSWICFLALMSFICFVAILLTADFWNFLYFDNRTNTYNLIIIAAFNIIITVLFNAIKVYYRILGEFKLYSFCIISQGLANFIAIAAALYFYKALFFVLFFTLISDILVLIIFIFKILDVKYFNFNERYIKLLLKYGYVLIPASYATWILNSVDKISLVQNYTLAEVGIYSLAYGFGYLTIQLFVNPLSTLFPSVASLLYAKDKLEILLKVEEYSKQFILLSTISSAIFYVFCGKDILLIFSTKDFIKGWSVIPLITLAYLQHSLAAFGIVKLGLINKQYYNSISIIAACIANIILNIVLVPKFGIEGAAISLLCAYCLQNIIVNMAMPENFSIKYREFYFKLILKLFFSALLLCFIEQNIANDKVFKIVISFLVIVAVYLKDILEIRKGLKDLECNW